MVNFVIMTEMHLSPCICKFDVAPVGNDIKLAVNTWEFLCTHKIPMCLPIAHNFAIAIQASINGS